VFDSVPSVHEKLCITEFGDVDAMAPGIPEFCCMSGCPNCVYIQYAVEMASYYNDNGHRAMQVIDAIKDETLKAFIKMEVKEILLNPKR
jgi:hypothetical protein